MAYELRERFALNAQQYGIIRGMEMTINDDRMGGGKDMILAGRHHILRQLGHGGKSGASFEMI